MGGRAAGTPDNLRGTYAGLASEAAIAHLKELGVTEKMIANKTQAMAAAALAP